jgi:hypothetical protein
MEPDNKNQLLQELESLRKPTWGYKDVMAFFHCRESKAESIMRLVRKKGGSAPFEAHKVLADAVIEAETAGGTSRDREIAIRVSILFGPTDSDRQGPKGKGAAA